MKLLLLHCDYVRYADRAESSRPSTVRLNSSSPRNEGFREVLLVLTCCEASDGTQVVSEAAVEVQKISTAIKPRDGIVIMPFAHLSADLASPRVARGLLLGLHDRVRPIVSHVDLASFGWHKELSVKIKGHPCSVAFRSLPTSPFVSSSDQPSKLA